MTLGCPKRLEKFRIASISCPSSTSPGGDLGCNIIFAYIFAYVFQRYIHIAGGGKIEKEQAIYKIKMWVYMLSDKTARRRRNERYWNIPQQIILSGFCDENRNPHHE